MSSCLKCVIKFTISLGGGVPIESKNVISLSSHIHINNNQLLDTKWQTKINLTKDLFLYDIKSELHSYGISKICSATFEF